MRRLLPLLAMSAMVHGCAQDQQGRSEDVQSMETRDATSPAPATPSRSEADRGQIPASLPRIAYSYGYTFRLSSAAVPQVQERHRGLCHQLGPVRCRIVNLRRSAASGDYLTASTTMQVAAPIARAFGDQLIASATEQGAETVDRSIAGEDLSRQMIDTEARIRTRETLIRRLTTLLETRSGNIQQAVEAERAIITAQEELDAARGWLAEMRTRVDMSTFTINYHSGAPLVGGVGGPIREAVGQVGSLFARSVGTLILLVGVLLPWLLLVAAIFYSVRWFRRRRADGEAPTEALSDAPVC